MSHQPVATSVLSVNDVEYRLRLPLNRTNANGISYVHMMSTAESPDSNGFVIEHVGDMNADEVGAILSTSIGAVEAMGRDANQGRLEEIMAEFADGTVLLAPIGGEAVLGVVARHEANLGRIRYEVKKRLRELERGL